MKQDTKNLLDQNVLNTPAPKRKRELREGAREGICV